MPHALLQQQAEALLRELRRLFIALMFLVYSCDSQPVMPHSHTISINFLWPFVVRGVFFWVLGRRALKMMLLGLLDQAVLTAAAQKEDAGQVRLFGSVGGWDTDLRFPPLLMTCLWQVVPYEDLIYLIPNNLLTDELMEELQGMAEDWIETGCIKDGSNESFRQCTCRLLRTCALHSRRLRQSSEPCWS